jgi:hypothetical protein
MNSRRSVGMRVARLARRSIRRPVPNSPTMTQNSLAISQMRGEATGSSARGMPGSSANAPKPKAISSADVAGSRPDRKRGSQNARRMLAPSATSITW